MFVLYMVFCRLFIYQYKVLMLTQLVIFAKTPESLEQGDLERSSSRDGPEARFSMMLFT